MIIKNIVQGDLKSNTYVVSGDDTNESVIIDPACDPLTIKSVVKENGFSVKAVLITHGHYDHIGAADDLRKTYNCPVLTGKNEAKIMSDSTMNLSGYFNDFVVADATDYVEDKDTITPAFGLSFKIIFVPGHSPDGVCFYNADKNVLFSGDTLMEGRIGSTDFYPGSSFELADNIKNKIIILPESTIVYSGHGKKTTIGHEKEHNHYFGKNMWV